MNRQVDGVTYAGPKRRRLLLPLDFYEGEICCQNCPAIYRDHNSETRSCKITGELLPLWQKMVGEYCPLMDPIKALGGTYEQS